MSFKYNLPEEHEKLSKQVARLSAPESIVPHLNKVQRALSENGIKIEDLAGRPKHVYGVHNKLKKKGKSFNQVYDLRAMRIVVSDEASCFKALDLVHSLWQPIEGRTKDYISKPKPNGYQSLHTVVVGDDGIPFEIQVRSVQMHKVAEYGVAAHWRYKEAADSSPAFSERQVAWARYVLSWHSELTDHKCRADCANICAFPEHKPGCRHNVDVDPDMCLPCRSNEGDPVYIILDDDGEYRTMELSAQSTAGTLLDQLAQERTYSEIRLLVNDKEVDANTPICMGNRVRVFTVNLDLSAAAVNEERCRLGRLYRSGEFSGGFSSHPIAA